MNPDIYANKQAKNKLIPTFSTFNVNSLKRRLKEPVSPTIVIKLGKIHSKHL